MHKEKFMIYRRDAKKGEATYSPKSHSAPHFEGHYVEGMEEWASWYCFNKKDDGTYEAELDEAWNEGSHYGGGTINVDIPKEWFALSYDEFLERVITLAAAKHYGFTVDELKDYLLNGEWRNMEGIDIQGIMCMATNTDDEERILNDFRTANEFSRFCAERFGDTFRIRSWGMSGDYLLAVREGSNLVRIGSKIFGERVY